MGKFCPNCGKKVEECKCEKKSSNDFVETSKKIFFDILNQVKGIFVKPVDTLKKNISEDKFVTGLVILCANCILAGIIALLLAKQLVALFIPTGGLFSLVSTEIKVPYVKIFFTAVFVLLLMYVAIIGLTYLIVNKLMKDKTSIKKITSWFAVSSIIMLPTLVVIIITSLISYKLSAIVLMISSVLRNYYLYKGLDFATKIDDNKKAYVLTSSSLISLIVVGFIVTKMF